MFRVLIASIISLVLLESGYSQQDYFSSKVFSHQDSLRGALREARMYDVHFYDLDIDIDIENRKIEGSNSIYFKALQDLDNIQIDLFENMNIDKIEMGERKLEFNRIGNAAFINVPNLKKGEYYSFKIHYSGYPTTAKMAPWDGGFVWSSDNNNRPWVGVACEGTGASLWWPNKDHLSDEPDSMMIRISNPDSLKCISNGNLILTEEMGNGRTKYHWKVSYPINNYNVTLNIADYAHFSDRYTSLDGDTLNLDYYVLQENLETAKEHFKQVHPTLKAFEFYFGKYPFWEDGFALVETPYLGMEHQSCIAYGNKYKRGYLGGMIPRDMNWDYIIVHETGHEYWGNSISCNDHAEMWIHESFTTYMESLFVEYTMSKDDAYRYLMSQRRHANRVPIVGPLDVNFDDWGNSDHYFKGAWILHTLRNDIGNDDQWFDLIKKLYQANKISHMTTGDIISFISEHLDKDYEPFFKQYLYHPKIPKLYQEYNEKKGELTLELAADDPNFSLTLPNPDSNGDSFELRHDQKIMLKTTDQEAYLKLLKTHFLIQIL